MIYVYPKKDLHSYPGTIHRTEEWDSTYKIKTAVERDITHIKEKLCLAGRRTQNEKTLFADLILAGITQLIQLFLQAQSNIMNTKSENTHYLGLTNFVKLMAY